MLAPVGGELLSAGERQRVRVDRQPRLLGEFPGSREGRPLARFDVARRERPLALRRGWPRWMQSTPPSSRTTATLAAGTTLR